MRISQICESGRLAKIAAEFTVSGPTIPQKSMKVPLSGSVRADLGKDVIGADLVTKFDQSNIKAKLGMEKSAYNFDVAIDQLNVDKYLPPKEKGAAPGGEGKPPSKEKEPEKPIDLSALKVHTFAVAMGGGSLFRIAISAAPFLLPLMFQVGFGMNAFMS